jgi:hypothetical protein
VVRSFPGGGRAIVLLPAPDGGSIFSLHLGSLAEDIPAGALRFLGALCGFIPACALIMKLPLRPDPAAGWPTLGGARCR